MRSLVSWGIEAAVGASFKTSDSVVGESFRCLASSFRLIDRPAALPFRPSPIFRSGTVGVSHETVHMRKKDDLVRRFPLDKRCACPLSCESGNTIYKVSQPATRAWGLCP